MTARRTTTALLAAALLALAACTEEGSDDTTQALAAAETRLDTAIGDPALARITDLTLVRDETAQAMGTTQREQSWTANITVDADLYIYHTEVLANGAQVNGLKVGTAKGTTVPVQGMTILRQNGEEWTVVQESFELPNGLTWQTLGYAQAYVDGGQNLPVFGTPEGDAAIAAAQP